MLDFSNPWKITETNFDPSALGKVEANFCLGNIGLIEVMGLAVLPSRLKEELAAVADALVSGADLRSSELTKKHTDWAEGINNKYDITTGNALDIVQKETGLVFANALEHAGVFARTIEGKVAFLRFLTTV